jgi:hypothetical protein
VKLLTVQFSSNPCYLLLLRPKDLPQHHIPKHLESMLFYQCKVPSFTPIYAVASKCFRNQFISENTKQYNHLSYTSFNLWEPCVRYIERTYRYPPNIAFYIFFSTAISTYYCKHAAHSPFFSSKCCLFHNATIFGSCIIHILHTGCVKI